mgnify:CR=1 FL=1
MVARKFLQITWISGIMNFYDSLGISMFRHEKAVRQRIWFVKNNCGIILNNPFAPAQLKEMFTMSIYLTINVSGV